MNQWPGVQCKRIVTLHLIFFELLPFVNFHTLFLSWPFLLYYKSYRLETSNEDGYHWEEVQCLNIITLHFLFFELLPFVDYFCLSHFSYSIKAIDFKLHVRIDIITKKCSAQKLLLFTSYFLSYCPLLIIFVRAISPIL